MVPFDEAKLQRLLNEAKIDLLLATTRHNVRYLTGGYVHHFHSRATRMGSSQYLAVVGVPRGQVAETFYLGMAGEAGELESAPMWIGAQSLDAGTVETSAAGAAQRAHTLGVGAGVIGVEMPFLPASAFVALQTALPHATFVDATDLLHELRAIKTPAELAILRAVSAGVADAIHATFLSGTDGITTRTLATTAEREMGTHGIAFLWAFTNAGPGYLRAPAETRWERGQLLHLDCGGEGGDHLADLCRMGALGEPSALGRELTAECLTIQDAVRRQLRPGMTYGEVRSVTRDALGGSAHAGIGRIVAHGIGMVSHEQPMIGDPTQADRTLAAGHVLSLETEFHHPDIGHVKIEDTLAVTPDGTEGFGDTGRELTVVG